MHGASTGVLDEETRRQRTATVQNLLGGANYLAWGVGLDMPSPASSCTVQRAAQQQNVSQSSAENKKTESICSPDISFSLGVEYPLVSPGLPRSIAMAHQCPSGPCFDVAGWRYLPLSPPPIPSSNLSRQRHNVIAVLPSPRDAFLGPLPPLQPCPWLDGG